MTAEWVGPPRTIDEVLAGDAGDQGAGVEDQAPGLDPLDREAVGLFLDELAPRLAAEVLDRLQPGLGPMVIPAAVARAVAAYGHWGNSFRIAPGIDELTLDTALQRDGSIFLRLSWQGNVTVWSGSLRPAEPVRA